MNSVRKPLISFTVFSLLALTVCTVSCRFSFAGDKHPQKGSIEFGSTEKPVIHSRADFAEFKNIFADVAEKTIPTVVSITSTIVDTVTYGDPFSQFFGGSPFDEFFGNPRGRQGQPPVQKKEERRTTGFGSGVIVSKDGYILTNYHVVGEADEITVELADDREFEAEVIGSDSLSDVAVIKIKEKIDNLPVAFIGSSDKLRPGDWVMAIGNPFNLNSTVTTGIVSAIGRHTGGITMYQNFIQTDAAINPGNSGGALVNIDGELIGINTMIYTRTGGYMGIGFAIPINMARAIMEQIIFEGSVSRGWLGVGIADIDANMKDALGLSSKKGVLINDVFKGQPAEKAGIKVGDVVLSIDGVATGNANELKNTVASIPPTKKVPVVVIRDGKQMTIPVVLDKRDEDKINKVANAEAAGDDPGKQSDKNVTEMVGFTVGNLTAERREQLGLASSTSGVVVLEINSASPAAQKGIKPGDLVKRIKAKGQEIVDVKNVDSFNKALKGVKKGDSAMFYLEREGQSFFVAIKMQ